VRGVLVDFIVPGLIGGAVLVVVDVIRGESAPWWLVGLIFVVVFTVYEGMRILIRRSRS
jgi:FtsH-binding integral membrane protein